MIKYNFNHSKHPVLVKIEQEKIVHIFAFPPESYELNHLAGLLAYSGLNGLPGIN
ncbi:hypothetical protein DFO77_1145 [Marinilabilia salmonicolor]|jgi:hypothetical protein|uniref:Uncharacterized protein n=1 Tax=Marinilabilia salmonicolor TaxID=989 RepID=A0A2T0XDL5_9BACT|nr:hypothetical protein BY457_11385 [Marinilabilia salmonicolor]RCW32679.1 hypothetical protein DFO77_1145 [Marinilabilia salmonicolor]